MFDDADQGYGADNAPAGWQHDQAEQFAASNQLWESRRASPMDRIPPPVGRRRCVLFNAALALGGAPKVGGMRLDKGGQQVATSPENSRSLDANELLVRAARGDQDAFCALYDVLADVIFHRCLMIVRDIAHAEDALQDTFFELWRTAPRYDPALGSARNWTLKIAHHRAVDKVRRIQSMTEGDRRDAARQSYRPFDEVAEEIILRAERDQVRELLGELTERQRLVIDLVYYQGHSLAETAALLDIPLGTVKTRVRDAMIRLRTAMLAGLDDAPASP